MSAIEISAQLGLFAVWLLTCNMVLGLLLSVRYNPLRSWPHRRINYFTLHNWTGYIALALAGLHAVVLVFSSTAGWTWLDAFYPAGVEQQPIANLVGAVSFYLLFIVVATSYARRQLGRKSWKAIHYVGYASAVLFYIHGILLDPKLLDRPVNWIDAEKVSIELCVLVVLPLSIWRMRYALRRRTQGRRIRALNNWDEPIPVEWAET